MAQVRAGEHSNLIHTRLLIFYTTNEDSDGNHW